MKTLASQMRHRDFQFPLIGGDPGTARPDAWRLVLRLVALAPLALVACSGAPGARTSGRPSSQAPVTVCVLRHAQALKNIRPLPAVKRSEDLDALTPLGRRQARAWGRTLPRPVTLLWTSPTRRTRQTARELGLSARAEVVPELRSLGGKVPWKQRLAQWANGKDPRPAGGESLADGRHRARALLQRLRLRLRPKQRAVLVTHGDLAAILIGELRHTPLLARPTTHRVGTGKGVCLPLPTSP